MVSLSGNCSVRGSLAYSNVGALPVCVSPSEIHTHIVTPACGEQQPSIPGADLDVKGFVFCQQNSSTSHDNPLDSHWEGREQIIRRREKEFHRMRSEGFVR